jgi:FkbM family methyltransferase
MIEKIFKLPRNKVLTSETEYFTGKGVSWQKAGRAQVIELIKNKNAVIDIGAHVGITTVHWLDSGFTHVHAFEINPSHFTCLTENTVEYNDRVTLYPYGCSFEEKTVKAGYRTYKNSGSFQMLDEKTAAKFPPESVFEVSVKRLDTHTFDNISLIKIDVEGWEYEVIQGAIETIKTHRPIMFVEYSEGEAPKTHHKYDNKKFLELIASINYKIQKMERDFLFLPN